MSLLAGKIGIVFGVANKRSIAWAIAQAWHKAGAHETLIVAATQFLGHAHLQKRPRGDRSLLSRRDVLHVRESRSTRGCGRRRPSRRPRRWGGNDVQTCPEAANTGADDKVHLG